MLFKIAASIVIPVSIWLAVFSIGAKASFSDLLFLLRQPHRLLRAMTAIFVVVPVFAVCVSLIFHLAPEIEFALVALSVSPIPPTLHLKQAKLGAQEEYVVGLLVAASVVSLIATPLLLGSAATILGSDVAIAPREVARVVAFSIGLPLVVGIGLHGLAPRTAEMLSPYAAAVGRALLMVGVVVILFATWRNIMAEVGNGSVIAIAATVIVGLLAGHLLGSEHGKAHAALALAAAARHPGVAMAIAAANFPERQKAILAAILLFLMISGFATSAYVLWMKRQHKFGLFHLHLPQMRTKK